jgi:outer membrane protein OmpA-like peptidoglycan-associated protein
VPREVIRTFLVVLLFALPARAATPLRVEIDKSRALTQRTVELRMNHAPSHVEVKVFGMNADAPLVEHEQKFTGHAPGEALVVTWPDPGGEVARIEVRSFDTEGASYTYTLTPWFISIPHEEVNFATDSAVVTAGEAPKLESSMKLVNQALDKHRDMGAIKLFILGHTDTVGLPAYNLKLSQARAQSIAAWFRKRGLKIPIYFEGMGEQSLLVATPDQTDEPRNRRVEYILGVESPPLKAVGFRPAWKTLR